MTAVDYLFIYYSKKKLPRIPLTAHFFFLQNHFDGIKNGSVPDDVPNSSIPGVSIFEKLQNIYMKNVLFYLHISKVEEIQNKLWIKQTTGVLSRLKYRLSLHLVNIKHVLVTVYPDVSLPPTPTPLQLSHDHDFQKKNYGWGVIIRLKQWLQEVLLVLDETKNMCGSRV